MNPAAQPGFRFSASGIATGRRCQAAWAYCYIDGLRRPNLEWKDVTPATPSRDRSLALGTEVHNGWEAWYAARPYDWSSLPGQIVVSGQHLVPSPGSCYWHESEGKMPALEVGGVSWTGRMDLLVSAPLEFQRMGIKPPNDVLLTDFKATSSISSWALTPAELLNDLQANLYGLAVMNREGFDALAARWVYTETKRVRRAAPVDVLLERSRAEEVVGEAAEFAAVLRAIESSEAAPKNTAACGDYGGCEYHVKAGGPCNAQRNVGALIALRAKSKLKTKEGTTIVGMPPDVAERLKKFKKPGAETAANDKAEKPKPAPAKAKPAAASTPAPAAEAPAEEKRGRGRPPGAKNKKTAVEPAPDPAPVALAPREGSRTQQLTALAADLAAAEEAELEAAATREAIEAAIRELMA